MKIAFNKKIVVGPWGGGNQILVLLCDYLKQHGHQISFSLEPDVDVVVMMDVKDSSCLFPINSLMEFKRVTGAKIVHRINDNGSHRKGNAERSDDFMIAVNEKLADRTIFISGWLKKYYEEKGLTSKVNTIIPNATDRTIFYPNSHVIRQPTDPLKIITHHWSSNMSKGFAIYDKLAKFCFQNPNVAKFTFLGNCPSGLLADCEKISPKPYLSIPSFLMYSDLYVTATQFESGGCHIVEGMGCGLIPLVRKGSGGPEEYSKGFGMYFYDIDQLIEQIRYLHSNYGKFLEMRKKIREQYLYDAKDMCSRYMAVIGS